MNTIKLYTVIYDETGCFMLGLKNRVSYFTDDKISPFVATNQLSDLVEDLEDEKDKFDERNTRLSQVSGTTSSSYANLAKDIQANLKSTIETLERIQTENKAYVFSTEIQELKNEIKRITGLLNTYENNEELDWNANITTSTTLISDVASSLKSKPTPDKRPAQEVFEGGKATFPSADIKGQWTDFFEKRELNVRPNKKHKPTSKQCLWIVKDVCALKKLLQTGIDIFKNHFGGYDLFHELVSTAEKKAYEHFLKSPKPKQGKKNTIKLKESKVISIDFETYYCTDNKTQSPDNVAIYIKLTKSSYKALKKQVHRALAIGAQYANEIEQDLYPNTVIKDSKAPKTNDFNRLISQQHLKDWSAASVTSWEVAENAKKAIQKLQVLEALVKPHRKDDKNHNQDLVRLKEEIELLVKSNNISVQDLMKHYDDSSATPFKKSDDDSGTDQANYALYQIIVEYNHLLHKMNHHHHKYHQTNYMLEIPKQHGHHPIIKQAACLDKPVVHLQKNTWDECEHGKIIGDKNWRYIYSLKKIDKNIWPQVNKIYQLMSEDGSKSPLDKDIRALSKKVVEQRAWQSFIIHMRNDSTLTPANSH